MRKVKQFISCFMAVVLLTGCVTVSVGPEQQTENKDDDKANTDIDAVQKSIRPQDDYYGYINQQALANMEIGYGNVSAGTFDEVQEAVDQELQGIISGLMSGADFAPGSNEQLIADLYRQCLDYDFGTKLADTSLRQAVEQIEAVTAIDEYAELMGRLGSEYGVQLLLLPCVTDDYFNVAENALCIDQMTACAVESLEELYNDRSCGSSLKSYVMDVLTVLGMEYAEADARSDALVYLMLEIAAETDFSIQYLDQSTFEALTFLKEEELQKRLSHIDLKAFEEACGIKENPYQGWYVQDAGQLAAIDAVLVPENLPALKTYAICELVNSYGMFLGDETISRYFELGYMEPNEKALLCVSTYMDEQLGELYAGKYDSAEGETLKEDVTVMCEDIRTAYRELILQADWLSEDARDAMAAKLAGIQFKIGAGKAHETDPMDAQLIGENLLETIVNLKQKSLRDNLELAGCAKDSDRFIMSACTVNACYNPDNTVTIPYAIMHAPFYDSEADAFTNLGGLGIVIGHEISHGFDSSCICFDDKGIYNPEWIGETDRETFEERMRQVEAYYSRFAIMDVYHVDGKLTLGENFADLGGMECIVRLAETEEELQKIFESYATIWCELSVDTSAIGWLGLDVHSPAMVRVNAVLSSTDAFYELYDLTDTDQMYLAPEERVRRW